MWIAFVLTLVVYSYLFLGDTFLYRMAEHLFVGSMVGYAVVLAWHHVLWPRLFAPLLKAPVGNVGLLVPLILGLLLLTKGSTRFSSLGNVSMAFLFGVGAAVAMGGALFGSLAPQIGATMVSLNPGDFLEYGLEHAIDNFIIVVGTLSTLLYFYFTADAGSGLSRLRAGFVRFWAGIGRVFIVVAFGAIFADTVMARVSLLVSRIHFLLDTLRTLGL